jgi:hypothetical protein
MMIFQTGSAIEPDPGRENEEKSPLEVADARLLLDAIKELNISKRNIGLYPRDHPQTKESLEKAFRFLQKLFESKGSITLAAAKDTLMIDNAVLDKKNPALKEFALSLYSKGIASVTLNTMLTIEELFGFHELITGKDIPMGPALLEVAEQKGLRNIKLLPLNLSKLKFVEGITRKEGADNSFWNDYISALLDGRLTDDDIDDITTAVSPEGMAAFINKGMAEDNTEKACEAVTNSYLGRKGSQDQRAVLFGKFLSMVDNLTPELKQQFLDKSFTLPAMHPHEVERLLGELTFDDIEKMIKVFDEHASLLPDGLKNLVDRLESTKTAIFAEIRGGESSYVDDIEVGKIMATSLEKDHSGMFLDKGYREELKHMTEGARARGNKMTREFEEACRGETLDRTVSEIVFELLNIKSNSREEYQKLLSNLADMANGFIETGRFSEISEIYKTVYSQSLTVKFRKEAAEMINGFFGSQIFLFRLIDAFKVWRRHNKDGIIGLSSLLKNHVIPPFLDALSEEKDLSARRFFLDMLCQMGEDVAPEAVKRIDDERWYVTRNMIYLVRECNGSKFIKRIRQFTKHQEERVVMEAVKTLLQFGTPDSASYVRFYVRSTTPRLREQAIRLAGIYKVKEAAPDLIALLEEKDLFGTKSIYKGSAVNALGEIGDPSALKVFRKIYDSNALVNKPELEKLKIEIFKSLHNYPFQEIKPLVENGLKSRIGDIRAICEKLLKSSGRGHD